MKRAALVLLAAPLLAAFTPFASGKTVCATCPPPSGADVVVLKGGERVWGSVTAKNADYYVVRRNGEVRAAELTEVDKIEWHGGLAPGALTSKDQIRTKGGVVLDGKLVEEEPGRYLVIEMASVRYVVWMEQIRDVHKLGNRYTPKPAPAAAAQ